MLKTRVVAAVVLAPPLLILVWLGGVPLALICALLSLLMLWEAQRLLVPQTSGLEAIRIGTWVAGSLLLGSQLLPAFSAWFPAVWSAILLVLLTGALFASAAPKDRILAVSGAFLAVGYTCALLPNIFFLRQLPTDGLFLTLVALFCTWGADTGAYFSGRAFGRHKLAPQISPGKTLEGALGGWLLAVVVACGLRAYFHPAATLLDAALLGIVATLASICGDLSESLFKRAAGIKDSSHIIPGHGGVLDRFDGVLFAAPLVYLYALLILP